MLSSLYLFFLSLDKRINLSKFQSRFFVISIGNLSVGGTGKTPFCIYLASKLKKQCELAIVTRSYRTGLNHPAMVGDNASLYGDEAVLLKKKLPDVTVASGPKKWRTVKWLQDQVKSKVVIVDDGFQHWPLKRDIDIVLVDATQNDFTLLPFGRMREPLDSLKRADAIVVTKSNLVSSEELNQLVKKLADFGVPIAKFGSKTSITVSGPVKVVLLTGVARPEAVKKSVDQLQNIEVVHHMIFPDHHSYQEVDFARIKSALREYGADHLLTTQKDQVKFDKSWPDLLVLDHEMYPISQEDEDLLFRPIAFKLKDFI